MRKMTSALVWIGFISHTNIMFIILGEVGAKLEVFVSSPLTLSSIYPHVLDYITHIIILSSTYKIACVWRLIFEIGFRNTMG